LRAEGSPRGLTSGRELAQRLARAAGEGARASVQAVLLDALGTLLELEPPAPHLRAELAARGVVISKAEAATALDAEIAYYRAHHDEAVDVIALGDLRDRCTAVLAHALPEHARATPDLRGALLASLRFWPYPEVPEVLGALRAAGLRLVVVSNWDVSLHEALERAGLAPLLDGAISSAEAGAAKPAPAIFERALALAGDIAPAAAVHVGDDAARDVAGARAAGIAPVLVLRNAGASPDGVPTLADLQALPELLTTYPQGR
jgi:putative hydrolase of the HAD superfamily